MDILYNQNKPNLVGHLMSELMHTNRILICKLFTYTHHHHHHLADSTKFSDSLTPSVPIDHHS